MLTKNENMVAGMRDLEFLPPSRQEELSEVEEFEMVFFSSVSCCDT